MPRSCVSVLLVSRLLLAEVAALTVLARLGSAPGMSVPLDHLATWLRDAPPEEVVTGALRLAATAVVAALVVLTLAGAAVRATGSVQAVRRVDRLMPRLLRRALDRAAVLSLAAALAPSVVSLPPVIRDGRAVESIPAAAAPATAPSAPPPSIPAPSTPERPSPAPATAATARHTVVPGEHLWAIAARRVGEARGVDVAALAAADVTPYWRALCDLNRPHLASGDPNLVYPGEDIELPPLA